MLYEIPKEGEFTLRQCRTFLNLSIKDAAARIGIYPDTLANYEKGKSFPDVPIIKKIEDAYEIPYSRIIFLP